MAPGTAGYSGTPLPRKLGIRDGHRVLLAGAPEGFDLGASIGAVPDQAPAAAPDPALRTLYSDYVDQAGRLADVQKLSDDGQKAEARRLGDDVSEQMNELQADLEDQLGLDGGGN